MDKKMYELTNQQKNILSIEKYYSNTSLNTNCGKTEINEKINFDLLSQAITHLIKSNSIFSLNFKETNDNLKQFIGDSISYVPEIVDVSNKKELKELEQSLSHKALFSAKRLFEFVIYRFPNNHGGVIGIVHHLLSDSWGVGLMFDEILRIYKELLSGSYTDIPSEYSYINYVQKEQEYLTGPSFEKDKVFWNEVFNTIPDLATIPSIKNASKEFSCTANRQQFSVSGDVLSKINEFCKKNKASVYNFFMAVFGIYLGSVANSDDFVIGTPILNRLNIADKKTMGMFVSTVPFRINLEQNLSFAEFTQKIAQNTLSMLRHQRYPYQNLLQDLRKIDSSIPNLYNVVLSYQITKLQDSGFDCESSWVFNGTCADDIQIHILDYNNAGSLDVLYDYKLEKYSAYDITSINNRINSIIDQVLENENISLHDIEIVTEKEKNSILNEFNKTDLSYPSDKSIVQLFEEQVEKTPDSIALVFEDQTLTYRELNAKANSLAFYLGNHGVKNNDVIGIMVNRSFEMFISLLAVLKCGACYVPIDPAFPQSRIEYMLSNSKAKFLLTFKDLESKVSFKNKIFVELSSRLYSSNKQNLKTIIPSDSLAYIIYTSGSTGTPKGVMISHRNVNNFIYGMSEKINFLNKSIVCVTTFSFDIFVLESILPLQKGLKVVIANENQQNDARLFNELCIKNKINIIQTTPSRYQVLTSDQNELDFIKKATDLLVGGEAFPANLLDKLTSLTKANIYNVYGPTETTVWSTVKDITNSKKIAIGKPIANTQCFILGKHNKILPPLTPGNLFIGGDGLSSGYFDNKELTRQKFSVISTVGRKLYDTGDLAYFTPEGDLVHLGRSDFQVKINGHRIELGEIEASILKEKKIDKCVVCKKTLENGADSLCAYYISNYTIDISALRSTLKDELPNYMIPNYFIKLESFPYTPNGKLDLKNLPLPSVEQNREFVQPNNKTEKKLINILKPILNTENISITDSFFDLGGDSLSAINLCSKIYSEFKVQLFVKDIFDAPQIRDIANRIIASKESIIDIPKATMANYYPVSYAQSRIYFSSKIAGDDSILYNITGGLIFDKTPDVKKLEIAFNKIIKHQPSFRTYFDVIGNKVVQKVLNNASIKINQSEDSLEASQLDAAFKAFNTSFDLSKAPLLKVKLANLKDGRCVLMVSTHHIICDGSSLNILLKELSDFYNEKEVSPLTIDYKDYTIWEKKRIPSDKDSKAFWVDQFSDDIPVLDFPTKPRAAFQSYEGSNYTFKLSNDMFKKINRVSKALGITPYMLMLSSYYILLYKYSMKSDIVVGTPIVNRGQTSLQDLIGMFVNTLPVRVSFDSNFTFEEFVKKVKKICTNDFNHQDYPLDELINNLNLNRETGRTGLFDTIFTFQDKYRTPKFNDLNAEYYIPKSTIAKFDFSMEVVPADDCFDLSIEYASALFDDEFIVSLAEHYNNILSTVLENNSIKISDINMLSEKESNEIINTLNETSLDYPKDLPISVLFEKQAKINSSKIAVSYKEQHLTYAQLNKKANCFARYLLRNGIRRGDVLPVLLPRSINLIVAMLAANKIGAAYLPLSIEYPVDRINYIIENSKASLLVTDTQHCSLYNNLSVINIDKFQSFKYLGKNIRTMAVPTDTLYIIYTSGSTGNPKGVAVTNNNLNNFIHSFNNMYEDISNKDKFLAATNICFDVSIFEFYISLLNGAELHLYEEESISDIFKYCNTIINKNITMMYIPPNILEEVYKILKDSDYHGLNKLLIGVESIKTKTIKKYYNLNKDIIIINGYGPTETTICATAFKLNKKNIKDYEIIPIGKSLNNLSLRILDQDQNLLPQGVLGELYIGGENVAKGYVNNPDLTKTSFVKLDDSIFYKTGDIVFLDNLGYINFVGRKDSQIKVNGHRIELGEIEKVIYSYPNINKVVALLNNQNKIVAYFTASTAVNISDLKAFLQSKLPLYFVPNAFIQLDKFKLTPNGKIDRKSLLNMKLNYESNYVAPTTEEQQKLVSIFESVLNVEKIGILDNFFDLGGDSLSAIKLQLEAFNKGLTFSYKDIFDFPTIKQLAEKVSKKPVYNTKNNYNYSAIDHLIKKEINIDEIKSKKPKNILLTGSTGFVGSHVLSYLLSHTNSKVFCLIRKHKDSDSYTRLMDILHFYFGNKYDKLVYKRLFIVEGDISKDFFGIPYSYYSVFGQTIDCVINSAAVVKHYGDAKIFNESNIIGTKNIIDFCVKFNAELVHLSTLSVSGNMFDTDQFRIADLSSNILFNEKKLYIGQDLSNFYVYTKFLAERTILESVLNYNLKAKILRLGNITNRYSDGKFQLNISENAFLNRIKSFLQIGCIPDYIADGYIEFTPVDLCAEAIVKLSFAKTDQIIFHVFNDNHITFVDLIKIFKNHGIDISVVNKRQFDKRIKELLSMDKSNLSGIINDFDEKKKLSYTSKIKMSNSFTNAILSKLSFKWPNINNKYISKYISYLKSIGYID